MARIIQWELLKENDLSHASKWYEHVPERVVESDEGKLLWDFTIQTDHVIEHRRPDIVFLGKQQGHFHIIDIAVPGDARIKAREKENYQALKREVARLWCVNVPVTHIVVGALGMVMKNLQRSLQQIGVSVSAEFLQKAALLGTARILQKVLEA